MSEEFLTTLHSTSIKGHRTGMGSFGIEIETESKGAYDVPYISRWSSHSDGSLRNFGIEYVLAAPLSLDTPEYKEAIEQFRGVAKRYKFEKSTYTSVHVHLNFVDKSLVSLANFIVLYVLFENMLTRYCGPDRDGNLFCLKGADSEASIDLYRDLMVALTGSLKGFQNFVYTLNQNTYKYSALNIVPLKQLGSVEVRTHPGTTDIDEVDRWVRILNCLYEAADRYRDPREILRQIRDRRTFIPFVNHIFGDYSKYFDEKTLDEDIFRNLFYTKYMLYNVKNWDTFGKFPLPKTSFKTVRTLTNVFVDAGMTDYAVNNIVFETIATEDI
jgi:hypothetical protein